MVGALLTSTGVRAELVRGTGAGALLSVGDTVLGMLSLLVLARTVGASGVGAYAVAIATVTLVGIPAQAGLPTLVLREIGSSSPTAQWSRIRGVLAFANLTVLATSVGLAMLMALVTYAVSSRIGPTQTRALYFSTLLLPLMALGSLRSATLRGFGKIVAGQLPDNVIRPGTFLVLLLIVELLTPMRMTADLALLLQAIGAAVGFIVGAVMLSKALPAEVQRARPEFHAGDWLASCVPIAVSALLRSAQPSLAVLLVSVMCSAEVTGLFRLGQRAADLVLFSGNTIVTLTPPYVARYFASGDRARLQRLVTLTAQASAAGAGIVTVCLLLSGPLLLAHVFGPEFSRSYPQMMIMAASQLVVAFFGANALLLNMTGKERALSFAFFIAVVVQLVATCLLVPAFGSVGAAYALAASSLAWNGYVWWIARVQLGIRTTAVGL